MIKNCFRLLYKKASFQLIAYDICVSIYNKEHQVTVFARIDDNRCLFRSSHVALSDDVPDSPRYLLKLPMIKIGAELPGGQCSTL